MKIYALAVCFASLLCGAITFGLLTFNIVKIVNPNFTISPSTLSMYESNEAYRKFMISPMAAVDMARSFNMNPDGTLVMPSNMEKTVEKELSDEQITELRLKQRASILADHLFRAKQSLLIQMIILSICSILYFFHWKLARRFGAYDET